MDSPSMSHLAVVENVEEMPRWQNPMFEVPQHFNSATYPDWGTGSFSESRRRHMHGKPHHSKRGQRQGYGAERGSPPVSPQWQPQPPPPPSPAPTPTYTGFTEQQGPVGVNLVNLPFTLCRRNFLEAMLDQAGLADDIMGCVLGEDQETGKATIYVANFNAALKCVQHFGGRRWDSAGPPVLAQIAEGQSPPSTDKPPAKPERASQQSNDANISQEQLKMEMPSPALGFVAAPGAWAMPQPTPLPLVAVQGYRKGSDRDLSPKNAGSNSPKSSGSGSESPKPRWADLDDDDEKDHSEEREGSTSAGSTGRNREESFSFGCDVDTDDGF